MTRTGKIARLRREIRAQLNRRLQDGEPGTRLVEWLNSLPEMQAVLKADFGGRPLSEQNLSEWKQGGYQEWLAQQEALAQVRELAADAGELADATQGVLADHLATVLTARYASALAGWKGEATEEFRRKLRSLRGLCQDIVELRRGEHSASRLKIEQERLEREREKSEEDLVQHFKRWAKDPNVRSWVCKDCASSEEEERRMREVFGLKPEETAQKPPPTEEATEGQREESN